MGGTNDLCLVSEHRGGLGLPAYCLAVHFKIHQQGLYQRRDFRENECSLEHLHEPLQHWPTNLQAESSSSLAAGGTCMEAFWSICPTGLNNADTLSQPNVSPAHHTTSFTGLTVGCPTREMECVRLLNTTSTDGQIVGKPLQAINLSQMC